MVKCTEHVGKSPAGHNDMKEIVGYWYKAPVMNGLATSDCGESSG